MIKNKEIKRIK